MKSRQIEVFDGFCKEKNCQRKEQGSCVQNKGVFWRLVLEMDVKERRIW